jgi:hypothetical protein
MAQSASVLSAAEGAASAAESFIGSVMKSSRERCAPCELRLLFSPFCWEGENFTSNSKWLVCTCRQEVVALALDLFKKVPREGMCDNCQTIRNVLAKRELAKVVAK